jgi:hypothetical protein
MLVKTIGNATLLAYDKNCVLATDPWLGDDDEAYFGSWNLSHKIPNEIKKDISSAQYIWFSHGHPDHLNPHSVNRFKGKKILLPDHVGGRIKDGLNEKGFDIEVIPDRKWFNLSDKVRIFCITTVIQDAVLLIDVNKHLFVNLNDAGTRGCTKLVRSIVKTYQESYLLALSGYGDADMINCFDEDGSFIEPAAATNKNVGTGLSLMAKSLGIRNVIPFSSFHVFQRSDSIWASKYTTPIDAYELGFHEDLNFIPPFAIIDCDTGETSHTPVEKTSGEIFKPETFGDCWSDELNTKDVSLITNYFQRKEAVNQFVSFINFRIGGKDNFIQLKGKKGKGITFEVPRGSLMKSIEYEIFDDLLIGNFMKTTLHNMRSLYEGDFSLYVAKYGDNGRVESCKDLEKYFLEYNRRIGMERFYEIFISNMSDLAVRFLPQNKDSFLFSSTKKIYYFVK